MCQIPILIETLEIVKNVVCQNHWTLKHVDMYNYQSSTLLNTQSNAVICFRLDIVVVIFTHYCWY